MLCEEEITLILFADVYCLFRISKEKIAEFIESLEQLKDKVSKRSCRNEDEGFDFTTSELIEKVSGSRGILIIAKITTPI